MPEHLRWDWGGLKDVWVETSRAKGGDDCQGLESECVLTNRTYKHRLFCRFFTFHTVEEACLSYSAFM